MLALKVIQVLKCETKTAKGSEREFKVWRLLCDSPYFDEATGVHASHRVVFAASSVNFEFRKTKNPSFVFVTQSKRGLWLNGEAK